MSLEKELQEIEKIGWRSLSDEIQPKLDDLKNGIVILAPPLDTVPSPQGNAIYTIIQDLAERCPVPCLVLSIWPSTGTPEKCVVSDKILYCTHPIKPVFGGKIIPYRIKKTIWGTGRPELLVYAKKAAILCKTLGVKNIIVEDIPLYGLVLSRKLSKDTRIFLHQHIDAPLSYSKCLWKNIERVYTGIIFIAQRTLDDTAKKHGKLRNASVIYNGINLDHYDPNKWSLIANDLRNQYSIHQSDQVVLYVGRIIPGKGCLELIMAFLQANVPGTKLAIAGDIDHGLFANTEYSNKINQIVQNNHGNVIALGSISQNKLPGFYQMANLVVTPSLQSEGLPKVITEALVMGKPVLASDRGGTVELVKPGKNGWLIENPKDIGTFAELLKRILQDPEKLEEYSHNAISEDRQRLNIFKSAEDFFRFILQDPSLKSKSIQK